MISLDLASRLAVARAAAGQDWSPSAGDRFHIPDRDIDQVFVISDMTIETAQLPSGLLIRFNGTTEWALDSIEAAEVVWLPREEQLRAMLGDRFVALAVADEGWAVTLADGSRYADADPECAYALAVLAAG
ncbi:pilus assembly protein CpaE [Nocardioides bigeumensis]